MPNQNKLIPLWVRFAAGQKLAGLNAFSPLYLRSANADYGCGDFGDLFHLIDKSKEIGFSLIQLLPLYDTGDNPSPYMPVSFFALNPIYLWLDDPFLEKTAKELKKIQQKESKEQNPAQFDYHQVYNFKIKFLQTIYPKLKTHSEFASYKKEIMPQILTYAQFCALAKKYQNDWQKWPAKTMALDVDFYLFGQWLLSRQLTMVKEYAETKEIYLCLDKPLYLQLQSSDVWANPSLFYLQEDRYPQFVSGCNNPSDPFGAQIWGHPVFRFRDKSAAIEKFFLDCIKYLTQYCHVVRLDHVLALIWKYYLINPATDEGKYLKATAYQLLQKIVDQFPDIYFIAEDSGFDSEQEIDLPLRNLGLNGVRCLQWNSPRHQDINNFPHQSHIYSSTHDTQSFIGWYLQSDNNKTKINNSNIKTKHPIAPDLILQQIIKKTFQSQSQLTFVSISDLVFDTRRINTPGTISNNNWQKRMLRSLEDLNLDTVKNLIIKSKRKTSWIDKPLIVSKPIFPQVRNLQPKDKLKLVIISGQPVSKFIIHTNLGLGNINSSWQTLIFVAAKYLAKKRSNLYFYHLDIKINSILKGNYELAINLEFTDGKIRYLYEFGKNLKVNIL